MIIIKKIISTFLIFLFTLLIPFSAFAINRDFLDSPYIWSQTDEYNIVSKDVNNIEGFVKYYIDENDKTIYFNVTSNNINLMSSDDIKIDFVINDNEYNLVYDKNASEVYDGFEYSSKFNANTFFGALKFLNKNDFKSLINLTLYISNNDDIYLILENVKLDLRTKTTTKTNNKSTSKNSNKAEKTTKFKYVPKDNDVENIKKNNETKNINSKLENSSTKFQYKSPNNQNINNENTINQSGLNQNKNSYYNENNNAIITPQTNSKFSATSIVLLVISAILIVAGIVVIIIAFVKKQKNKKKNGEE